MLNEAPKRTASGLSAHDMNCKNMALMSRQQIIDKITNNSVRLYFRPAMGTARLFMPDFDKVEFFLQLRIAHDFIPQRSGPGRNYLNHRLHSAA